MYTGRFNRQAPDRKTPPSASILAALRLALGDVAHMFPPPLPCARPAFRPYHPAPAYTVSASQGKGEERSKTTTSFSHSSIAPPRKEQARRSSHARQLHRVSCKSLRGYCSQMPPTTTCIHQTNETMESGIGHMRPALESPMLSSFKSVTTLLFCRAGFIEQPGTKNCAEQEVAILLCYQMPRSKASRPQYALYLRLFMLSRLCSFRKTPPSWANSFAHPGVSPNPFRSVTTRHQTTGKRRSSGN